MNIHYLKHVPFEGLGNMEEHLLESGHQITLTNLYKGDALPAPDTVDLLIIMGGPMGVYDVEQYPWLVNEKAFIKQLIQQNKAILGICLGAQLIADVLGAKVSTNPDKEIGWFDIKLNQQFKQTNFGELLPDPLNALQWHGDTFEIPEGAIAIGSTEACANQGFLYNNKVLGLQFHLEMTIKTVSRLISHCGDELDNSRYVQTADAILENQKQFLKSNDLMHKIIDIYIK